MATEDDINPDVDLTDTFLSQVYETDLPNMTEEFKSSEKISPDVSFSDMRNLGHEKKSQHVLITSVILRQSFLSATKRIISTRTVGMCPCSYF